MMRIRRIDLCDARLFWDVQKQLDTESKFMMLEPEERRFDFSRTIGRISRFDFLVGADVDGKFVNEFVSVLTAYRDRIIIRIGKINGRTVRK